jgi:aspartokinase/homoserine dehydrogenase 1
MKILKFGGSSIRDAKRIKDIIQIVRDELNKNPIAGIVFSAFQGVTDDLLKISKLAENKNDLYENEFFKLKSRHLTTVKELISSKLNVEVSNKVNSLLNDLEEVLKGVYLIKELTPKTSDSILSFGEILSNIIINYAFIENGIDSEFLDAQLLIKTDKNFGQAYLLFEITNKNIKEYFKQHKKLQVITGFIASSLDNETTTLGRGGSDYTASVIGAALNAKSVEIWTDVNGVLTANPKKVRDAFPIKNMSYEEAIELSHFGAKVVYPLTMQPVASRNIPIIIKNTFAPDFKGTVISSKSSSEFPIKGISSIDEITLIRIQGSGMLGAPGSRIAERIFSAFARKNINVILIIQASSEHSICLAILPQQNQDAKLALEKEFQIELKMKIISDIVTENDYSIIAVVGENMRNTPGIAAKFFGALGDNKINISAIAQGSSELNISAVISKNDELNALNVIHHKFFYSGRPESIHLYLAGYGSVGSQLINLIQKNKDLYHRIRLHGVINSTKMLIKAKEISTENLKKELAEEGVPADMTGFIEKIKSINYQNSVFVDCTSNENVADIYGKILENGINVVAANKKATTKSYSYYSYLKETALKNGKRFLYETNVGAALPVISTMNDLKRAGDNIIKIEGVLSGTLSFIFNNLSFKKKFSQLIKEAKGLGYTEPDPREDLSGMDAARKLLILIREAGFKFEMNEIKVENLVPDKYRKIASAGDFMKRVSELDDYFEKKYASANEKDCVLRYIAHFSDGKATVRLQEVDKKHPFYNLSGTENIIAYYTDYYNTAPQVINGPGAGPVITAVGIISDIFKIFG